MGLNITILLLTFLILLFIGMPIAFALGLPGLVYLLMQGGICLHCQSSPFYDNTPVFLCADRASGFSSFRPDDEFCRSDNTSL